MYAKQQILREFKEYPISKNRFGYGTITTVVYKSEYTNRTKKYLIFVLHPQIRGKLHCIDLGLIELPDWLDFFKQQQIDKTQRINVLLQQNKPIVKPTLRLQKFFYKYFIKRNKDLMSDRPYKTLIYKNILTSNIIKYKI